MKEFPKLQTHNEIRTKVLDKLNKLFHAMNKQVKDSGDTAEDAITDKYNVVHISELSVATLLHEYEKLVG